MLSFMQTAATLAAIGGLLWIIAGLIASAFPDPEYEDEMEAEFLPSKAPGLPHHRSKQ